MDTILHSRIRRSPRGLHCTFSAPAGRRRCFRYLSIRIPGPGADGDWLATATVGLGPAPGQPGRGRTGIVIKFPVAWHERHGRTRASHSLRPLTSYHAREPLVLDFVNLLRQSGRSRAMIQSAAVALVYCVLQAETDLAPPLAGKSRAALAGPHPRP